MTNHLLIALYHVQVSDGLMQLGTKMCAGTLVFGDGAELDFANAE